MGAGFGPAVLLLGGLDPSGGAGLLADAEAVRELGARPLCVPTALTVQTRARARSFTPVEPAYLLESARALLEEEDVRAIKLGMLASPGIAAALAQLLSEPPARGLPLVVDPVLAASSGAPLFRGSGPGANALEEAGAALRSLWSRALLTPNALEAQALLGLAETPRSEAALEAAGRALLAAGAGAVLIKGGHADGDEAVDLLLQRDGWDTNDRNANGWDANCWDANDMLESTRVLVTRLAGPRLFAMPASGQAGSQAPRPLSARGTGCRLASALAAGLASGKTALEAARDAKALVARYIAAAQST